jgi:hypothetical protein
LHVLGKLPTTQATSPALFALGIFQIGSGFIPWASLDLSASHSWDDRYTPPCSVLLVEMGSWELELVSNHNPPNLHQDDRHKPPHPASNNFFLIWWDFGYPNFEKQKTM